jgi:hypothetical protein
LARRKKFALRERKSFALPKSFTIMRLAKLARLAGAVIAGVGLPGPALCHDEPCVFSGSMS